VQGLRGGILDFMVRANHGGTLLLNEEGCYGGCSRVIYDLLEFVSKRGDDRCTMGKLRLEPNE